MDLKKLLITPIDELSFAVVDTETTGMFSEHNRIMDIGIVLVKNGEIIDKWETLIDPEQEVPYWITNYTKLTTRDVIGKPYFKTFAPKITKYLDGSIFVAHNVGFDYWFLYHEMRRLGLEFSYPKLCTVQLGKRLVPHLPHFNLDELSEYYGIKISARHRALPDAEATALILIEFLKIAKEDYNATSFLDLDKLQKMKTTKDYPIFGRGLFKN